MNLRHSPSCDSVGECSMELLMELPGFKVAIAFIHKETAENFEWFFANCAVAGILLHDRATFSDRGKQRDAQLRLAKIGILHFKTVEPNIESIKGLMFKLQAASTLNEYEDVLSEIGNQFPSPRNVTVAGQVESQTVKQYLRTIYPTSWTRFGNNLLTQGASVAIAETWKNANSYGLHARYWW
ncbi:hypothetical protein GQ600_11764 [Phytophthora cactorum]|nr:hypothetical protein GQ600_11764 [Phytophthora cactorum]